MTSLSTTPVGDRPGLFRMLTKSFDSYDDDDANNDDYDDDANNDDYDDDDNDDNDSCFAL